MLRTEDLLNAARDFIPKSLDDLIRKNRELLSLEYISFEDLSNLNQTINADDPKGFLQDVFLYKRITKLSNLEPVCAVGYLRTDSERIAFHTSEVKIVDFNQNAFITASGSRYIIESFGHSNETDTTLLLHICYVSHRDGWGHYFDVPKVTY